MMFDVTGRADDMFDFLGDLFTQDGVEESFGKGFLRASEQLDDRLKTASLSTQPMPGGAAVNPVRVNIIDYAKAMGAAVEIGTTKSGIRTITVTHNGISGIYYNEIHDDTILNSRFGWDSLLTAADRNAGVGISIVNGNLYKDFT